MNGSGYNSILGAAKEATYGTGVAATDKIPFRSESLKITPSFVMHDFLHGKASMQDQQLVFKPAGGSIECEVPYSVLNGTDFVSTSLLIAIAMGANTWDATNSVNQITLNDDLSTSATLGLYKGLSSVAWDGLGTMFNSMTLSATAGESLKATFETNIYDLDTAASVNTDTSLKALPDDPVVLATFDQMVFRIGDHSGALSSADEVCISSMELSLSNNLSTDEQATPCANNSDAQLALQPVRNGYREVMLSVELPRYEADTLDAYKRANTALQSDITFTSGTNYIKIFLPNVKIQDNETPVAGPEAIKQTVQLKAFAYTSASDLAFADGTTNDGEVWIETKDARTAAIL